MEGIFLGRSSGADEAIVLTPAGDVARARSVTPRHEGTQVTKEMLMNVKIAPWEGLGPISHNQDLPWTGPEARAPERDGASAEAPIPRDVRFDEDLVKRYGLTEGCPKCAAIQQGDTRPGARHSQTCREKVKEAMKGDPAHAGRLHGAEERRNEWLGERLGQQQGAQPDDDDTSPPVSPPVPPPERARDHVEEEGRRNVRRRVEEGRSEGRRDEARKEARGDKAGKEARREEARECEEEPAAEESGNAEEAYRPPGWQRRRRTRRCAGRGGEREQETKTVCLRE